MTAATATAASTIDHFIAAHEGAEFRVTFLSTRVHVMTAAEVATIFGTYAHMGFGITWSWTALIATFTDGGTRAAAVAVRPPSTPLAFL